MERALPCLPGPAQASSREVGPRQCLYSQIPGHDEQDPGMAQRSRPAPLLELCTRLADEAGKALRVAQAQKQWVSRNLRLDVCETAKSFCCDAVTSSDEDTDTRSSCWQVWMSNTQRIKTNSSWSMRLLPFLSCTHAQTPRSQAAISTTRSSSLRCDLSPTALHFSGCAPDPLEPLYMQRMS